MYIWDLKKGMVLAQDVSAAENRIVPIIKKGTVLNENLIAKLKDHGVIRLLVEGGETPHFIDVPKAKPVIEKKLKSKAISALEKMFEVAGNDISAETEIASIQVVKEVEAVVEELVKTLAKDKHSMVNIADLKSYDECTYHHSLSVAVLAIAMSQTLGHSSDQIYQTGRCAIMHDIGKTKIPQEIINKTTKLSDEEFRIIRQHSTQGYHYLEKRNIGDEDMRKGILYHHERYDGTGYPTGLKGEEIPIMSRIISVADVYDALTSSRPYRMPIQPFEAVEYIIANSGAHFDYDVVKAFMKRLELYPIGCMVELSNGKVAIVLNNENPMRPLIKLTDTGTTIDLANDVKALNITIKQMMPEP